MIERDARLAESRALARMIVLTAELAKADLASAVAPFGLPVPLARALLVLDEPTAMSRLAGQLACDPSYVTGLAEGLEQAGLAERVQGQDRRSRLLVVTTAGGELRDRLADALMGSAVIERRLTAPERLQLRDLLSRVLGEDGGRTAQQADLDEA